MEGLPVKFGLFFANAGWLAEEFDAVGVPFRERAARTEESVRAIRSLWREEPESGEPGRVIAISSRRPGLLHVGSRC